LQHQYEVSCDELDFLVDLSREQEGVLGARMMGGGFGGCTLNLVKKVACLSFLNIANGLYQKRFGTVLSSFIVKPGEGCRLVPQEPN
ncbi:MAG: galactokinase, partial [Muriicola sp.]|nr:galactokinase [Muriicola sp.]